MFRFKKVCYLTTLFLFHCLAFNAETAPLCHIALSGEQRLIPLAFNSRTVDQCGTNGCTIVSEVARWEFFANQKLHETVKLSEEFALLISYFKKFQQSYQKNGNPIELLNDSPVNGYNKFISNGIIPKDVWKPKKDLKDWKEHFPEIESQLNKLVESLRKASYLKIQEAELYEYFLSVIDPILGSPPSHFIWKGRKHTPTSFANLLKDNEARLLKRTLQNRNSDHFDQLLKLEENYDLPFHSSQALYDMTVSQIKNGEPVPISYLVIKDLFDPNTLTYSFRPSLTEIAANSRKYFHRALVIGTSINSKGEPTVIIKDSNPKKPIVEMTFTYFKRFVKLIEL